MSEFRRDPLSEHWVIIAPNRAHRPEQFDLESSRQVPRRCPFCRGHEGDTPGEVASFARDRTACRDSQWQVRVIPNKYPAVAGQDQDLPAPPTHPLYEQRAGIGVHEVIIESPDHVLGFTALEDDQVALVFHAYRERLRCLANDGRLAYAQVFKNSGAAAGASLEHVHSQLIATAVVPTQVQRELAAAQDYHHRHGRCVFCAILEEELRAGTRVVRETEQFVAFCPYASQFPYEVWVLPRAHASHLEDTADAAIREVAQLVKDCICRFEVALPRPDFNYLIHTGPFGRPTAAPPQRPWPYFHWHLEIFPRLVKTAGFEWGAGDYINTVLPEQAATTLRNCH
jgi:UDPglucose--hexose-1-phosphate uridylyltransferase